MPSRKPNDAETNDEADTSTARKPLTAERQNDSNRKTTFINGIGLWHSWTRNFKSPLLAVLDLLDNAFDAGFSTMRPNFKSKIHILKDEWISPQTNFTEASVNPFGDCVTGMVIANNSAEPICDILSILEVYKSAKADCESIGENGVGLKQGCATISDLSFVLIRSDERMAIGVIAKGLQHEAGAYLPSYPLESGIDIKGQLERIFTVDDPEVGQCVATYGFGDLKIAIERLEKHIDEMCTSSEWGEEQYVFRLVMDKIRYRNVKDSSQGFSAIEEDGDSYRRAVVGLMKELQVALPSQYIHIPEYFDVKIGTEKVYFNYWQCRLAEMSVFYVKVDPDNSFRVAEDWKDPTFGYHIRVFLGFDPIRFSDSEDPNSTEIKTLSLYLYSRQSGRLIRHEPDGRSLLGLTSGGTNYCQGFTVIVDDFAGQLPLNPTKQDVAFSEQANGQVHEKNLYAWINAISNGYYNYILDFFNGKKGELSNGVKGLAKSMKALFEQRCDQEFEIAPLAKARYTSYTKVQIPFRRMNDKIVCSRSVMTESRLEGRDTKFRLFTNVAMVVKEEEKKEVKRQSKRPAPRKKARTPAKRSRREPAKVEPDKEIVETTSSMGNSRYPSRTRRQANPQPEFVASSTSILSGEGDESESDIESKPPALVNVALMEAEKFKAEAENHAREAETWKKTAEKETREAETWKARARMLKVQYTEKKAYYERLLKKKEGEVLYYKNLAGNVRTDKKPLEHVDSPVNNGDSGSSYQDTTEGIIKSEPAE